MYRCFGEIPVRVSVGCTWDGWEFGERREVGRELSRSGVESVGSHTRTSIIKRGRRERTAIAVLWRESSLESSVMDVAKAASDRVD